VVETDERAAMEHPKLAFTDESELLVSVSTNAAARGCVRCMMNGKNLCETDLRLCDGSLMEMNED